MCAQSLSCVRVFGDPVAVDHQAGSSVHGILEAKNAGVGGHFLLQGLFPAQGLNLHFSCLLHWQGASLTPPMLF